MEVKQKSTANRRLLRMVYPDLYDYFMAELSSGNLHSYDVELTCHENDDGVELQVRYGMDFNQEKKQTFSVKAIEEIGDDVKVFCENLIEISKEALIADYFKMVKP